MFSLKQIFSNLRIADILDILVVTVFLYFIFSWLRRRASRSIVIGIGSVVFLYILARMTNMYMTSMVFQAGLTAALITLVIIFQDDIRMAIERLATMGTFHSRHELVASNKTVDSLIEAICNMARDKIGALIVMKGKESLDRHLSGGISLNGRISVSLLYSIFHPKTPSHDGAVIIEGDRIDKFGVRLPLSHNLAEVGDAGTRHTAALGISERSDALVLVVSEERGTISIADEGHLVIINREQLQSKLNDFYNRLCPPQQETRHAWLTQNYGVKILSLVIALTLWSIFAYRVDTVNRTVTIPVEYRNVPSGWILDNTYPAEIKVTLSGPERSFNFDQSILVASLDMNNVHEGKQSIPITEKQLNMPKSLNINSITPDEFSFRARKIDRVELPVRVKTKGRLPAHFKLSEIKAVPSTISLIIPLSQKSQITEILTEPLDLDPINQSTILRLNTVIPSGAQLIDQEQNSVRVSVTINDK